MGMPSGGFGRAIGIAAVVFALGNDAAARNRGGGGSRGGGGGRRR
jgi:hypothetical protein